MSHPYMYVSAVAYITLFMFADLSSHSEILSTKTKWRLGQTHHLNEHRPQDNHQASLPAQWVEENQITKETSPLLILLLHKTIFNVLRVKHTTQVYCNDYVISF